MKLDHGFGIGQAWMYSQGLAFTLGQVCSLIELDPPLVKRSPPVPIKGLLALAALNFLMSSQVHAQNETQSTSDTEASISEATPSATPNAATERDETQDCLTSIEKTVRPEHRARLKKFCSRIQRISSCQSTEGRAIQHVDFNASGGKEGKRILVLGLIHGDEPLAGEMTLDWAERLYDLRERGIEARNSWRVVPMLNPDGLERKTRMNARGVDLNRNFPTKDWSDDAVDYWKKRAGGDPRRFPGDTGGSEVETKCAIAHIKDFKPDFVVSVHTPYKVLDFDGPRMVFPKYKDLPWRALGNFPGSLGRFMWRDFQTPVLTVELGASMVDSAQLQDIVGTFAIEASRKSGRKTASAFDHM